MKVEKGYNSIKLAERKREKTWSLFSEVKAKAELFFPYCHFGFDQPETSSWAQVFASFEEDDVVCFELAAAKVKNKAAEAAFV